MGEQPVFKAEPGTKLLRQCSSKQTCRVDLLQYANGTKRIRRTYDHPVPAYAAMLGHTEPALPAIYSCREEGGLFLVEEEFVDGIPLSKLLECAHPDDAQTSAITQQVCRALSALHRNGYIHRDVKPDNILLTSEGRVVLLDLDASTQPDPEKSTDTQLLGTVGYAAPEQFGFGRSNVRTDVFSVGVLMNVLCTGRHPSQQLTGGRLRNVVERCIEVNAGKRYPSAEDLLHSLPATGRAARCPHCGFLSPGGGCIHCGTPGKLRHSRKWWAAAALIILLLLTAWILIPMAIRSRPEPVPPASELHQVLPAPEEPQPSPETQDPLPPPEEPLLAPARPLTDADMAAFRSCDTEDAVVPFSLNGETYYLHPSFFDSLYPVCNHGIDSREPERSLPFHITFWEKISADEDYREITDSQLLQQIQEAFSVKNADGTILLDENGQPVSSLALTIRAMENETYIRPAEYPAVESDPAYESWRSPIIAHMDSSNEGMWLITAAGTIDGQPMESSVHLWWNTIEMVSITPDPSLETPVVQQVNDALAQYTADEDTGFTVELPAGIFTGYIEIPESLSNSMIFINGSTQGSTVIQGGIHDEYARCEVGQLQLIGAGKDLDSWPADSPNAGRPNMAMYGAGGGCIMQSTIEDYAVGLLSTTTLRTGADNTYRNNRVAIWFDLTGQRGGNASLHSSLFQSNDTAILFQRIPSHLTLTWFEFYNNRFMGNGIDVDNRTGMYLPMEENLVLDENGIPKN